MTLGKARTKTVAGKYGGEAYRRWRAIKGLLRTTVADNDALGLSDASSNSIVGVETLAEPRETFRFASDSEKQQAFENWLSEAINDEFLEPVGDQQVRRGDHWSAKYVRSSFRGGLRDGGTRLREAGIDPEYGRDELDDLFNLPVNTDSLAQLYQRSYRELEDVSREVGNKIGRELADGFSQGLNPRDIAENMNEVVEDIGVNRARTIARTETAHTYNDSALNRYERNDVGKVRVVNPSPCPEICAPLIADNPYPVGEARGLVPAHPNCRGGLAPLASSIGGS